MAAGQRKSSRLPAIVLGAIGVYAVARVIAGLFMPREASALDEPWFGYNPHRRPERPAQSLLIEPLEALWAKIAVPVGLATALVSYPFTDHLGASLGLGLLGALGAGLLALAVLIWKDA